MPRFTERRFLQLRASGRLDCRQPSCASGFPAWAAAVACLLFCLRGAVQAAPLPGADQTPVFIEVGCSDGTRAAGFLVRAADCELRIWRETAQRMVVLRAETVQTVLVRPGVTPTAPLPPQAAEVPAARTAGGADAPGPPPSIDALRPETAEAPEPGLAAGTAVPGLPPFAGRLLKLLEARPELQQRLLALAEDARWKSVLDDGGIQQALDQGHYLELLANPKVQELARDDFVRQLVLELARKKAPAQEPSLRPTRGLTGVEVGSGDVK